MQIWPEVVISKERAHLRGLRIWKIAEMGREVFVIIFIISKNSSKNNSCALHCSAEVPFVARSLSCTEIGGVKNL